MEIEGFGEKLQAMKEGELASALKISTKTLQNWRWTKRGPRFFKVGGCAVRYKLADVESWLRDQGR